MILVEIAGFLGNDPEERYTSSGKRVISFRVGVKVRQGGKDETVWWRVSIWGDRFDKMLPFLRKGSAVIVLGEMSKPELYVDREGKTQVSLSISAEIVKFSPFGKPAGATPAGRPEGTAEPEFKSSSFEPSTSFTDDRFATANVGEDDSEDIPF